MRSSASICDIAAWIATLAPLSLAESWDKIGLQIGDESRQVSSVMTTLTLTGDVLEQAVQQGVQLIVAHHPLIFQPLVEINPRTRVGDLISRLIREDISLYVAHTNLDAAKDGVSDGLARRLGLTDVLPLEPRPPSESTEHGHSQSTGVTTGMGLGRIGKLAAPVGISAFVDHIKTSLSIERVRLVGPLSREVRHVAVVGGSGGSFIKSAHRCGADVLVTGDVDFHDADEALSLGVCVVDAGHFGTEKHVPVDLAAYLRQRAEASGVNLEVLVADESDPFEII